MSHKIAAPGPFPGGHQLFVDQNSTSLTEDGSAANPYKTIQAALNAIPAFTTLVTGLVSIGIEPGQYEEDLVIPPTPGLLHLYSMGDAFHFVILGDMVGVARNVTWNPVTSAIPFCELYLRGFIITGNVTLSTVDGVVSPSLHLVESNISLPGMLLTAGIVDPEKVRVYMDHSDGTFTVDAVLYAYNARTGAACTCYRFEQIHDCDFGGALTVTGAGQTSSSLKRTRFQGAVTIDTYVDALTDVTCATTLTLTAGAELRQCRVTGAALLTDCKLIDGCTFTATLGLLGVLNVPQMYNSQVAGLLTCTASPFLEAHSSRFMGGVTLAAVPTYGFFNCIMLGTFTGPALSYFVDQATYKKGYGNVVFGGAATPNVIDDPTHIPYTTFPNSVGYAVLNPNIGDTGWTGIGAWVILEDGTDRVLVQVVGGAGSDATKTQYDAGAALGWNAGMFANVFLLNLADGDLAIRPHWSKMTFSYLGATFGFNVGYSLHLEQIPGHHNLVTGRAAPGASFAACVAGNTLSIETVVFTAVTPGPANPAAQEFLDTAASGSDAATITSLAAAINDPASQALITAFAGAVVTARIPPTVAATIVLDSAGADLALVGATFTLSEWDTTATAFAITPGSDEA